MYAVASDPTVWEQHPVPNRYQRHVYTELFQELVESRGTLVVVDSKSQKIIGNSRYYDYSPQDQSVAIGFTLLARAYWGGSYNQELKMLMLNHAFQAIDRVVFHVGEFNFRSQKALTKIGAMQFDRSIKILPDRKESVSLHYRILKNDFMTRKS